VPRPTAATGDWRLSTTTEGAEPTPDLDCNETVVLGIVVVDGGVIADCGVIALLLGLGVLLES
jgi:hypothetical protein